MDRNYSHRTLIQKLGIKQSQEIVMLNSPDNYLTNLKLPSKVRIIQHLQPESQFIQFFTQSQPELTKEFPILRDHLSKSGQLWISWPKKSSSINSDLDENKVMQIGLENRLVDVKVISIDQNWSALKFVYRLKDRG